MDSKGLLSLEASQVLRHLDPSFGLIVSWAYRPLSLAAQLPPPAAGSSRYRIDNLVTANLQGAVGLWSRLELGLRLPLSLWHGERQPARDLEDNGGISAQGWGDLTLQAKVRLLHSARLGLGLGALLALELPTGDDDALLGSGLVTVAPRLILDQELWRGRLTLVLNAGLRLRGGKARFSDLRTCTASGEPYACGTGRVIEVEHLLTYGLGGALQLVPGRLEVLVELTGHTGLSGFAQPERLNSPAELLAGLKLYLAQSSYFALAAGRGLRGAGDNSQLGAAEVRLISAFVFEPAIGDRDGDGIKDDLDRCPDAAEDPDDFEDGDGCPDLDNDRDGIADVDDLCPDAAEDQDGFEDGDGCPDLDNDRDRIVDVDDRCPNQPETVNQFEDEDGCPDRRPFTVSQGSIDIMRPIHFETNSAVIKPVSFSLLEAIATFLQQTPEILRVEIQGHADERGSARYNLELTGRRAQAVKRFLVEQGVPAARLQARGYGESRPKDRRHGPAAWAVNRRVEFVIRQRAP